MILVMTDHPYLVVRRYNSTDTVSRRHTVFTFKHTQEAAKDELKSWGKGKGPTWHDTLCGTKKSILEGNFIRDGGSSF
jgi:hypothetical protein